MYNFNGEKNNWKICKDFNFFFVWFGFVLFKLNVSILLDKSI